MSKIEDDTENGLSRRLKLILVELVGFALMIVSVVHIALGYWGRGVGVLAFGAFVLLQPSQVVKLIERVFPPT